MMVGGTMSMPIDMSTLDTTRSSSRNGRKITNPMVNAVLSSLRGRPE